MRISEATAVDVRGPISGQRLRLLSLLGSLSDAQWAAPTAAPSWTVKDIALHLLDVDLSWLARNRDHDQSGLVSMPSGHAEFVGELDRRNQRWVDGARMLSPRLITDLLRWSGDKFDAYLGTLDLTNSSSVYWAGEAQLWFDLAREFTERWVHHNQIQDATRPTASGQPPDEYLPLVLRTFIWGFPHQYDEPAPHGTAIGLDIPGIGAWTLTRTGTGWSLDEGHAAAPAATLRMSGEAAWRLLTGASYETSRVQLSGDPVLAQPLLRIRSIIA